MVFPVKIEKVENLIKSVHFNLKLISKRQNSTYELF